MVHEQAFLIGYGQAAVRSDRHVVAIADIVDGTLLKSVRLRIEPVQAASVCPEVNGAVGIFHQIQDLPLSQSVFAVAIDGPLFGVPHVDPYYLVELGNPDIPFRVNQERRASTMGVPNGGI